MSFRTKAQARETKSGLSGETQRNKRVNHFENLRAQKREEDLNQIRRRRHNNDQLEGIEAAADDDQILGDIENIPTLIQLLDSQEESQVLEAANRLRQLVSIVNDPPFDIIIRQGGLFRFVTMLSHPNLKLAFEAAWCLTNIASGNANHTRAVVESGAIPPLVELLASEDGLLRDQAVWAIGNIAGESTSYRDMILGLGAMSKLLAIAHRVLRLCMLRNVSWTLSNLCRGRNPQPDFEIVSQALPTLHNMLNFRDDEVIADAAWSLSFLSDDTGSSHLPENYKIEMVLHSGVLGRLIGLLSHPNPNIKTPALRTVGNIVTGTNFQTQMVINANALPQLINLLSNSRRGIRREAAWALSNIAAGAKPHVTALVEANAFHALFVSVAQADIPVKREIVWVITNALSNRDPATLQHIASIGWIAGLVQFLHEQDNDLQLCALDALHHFLDYGQKNMVTTNEGGAVTQVNVYSEIVERAQGCAVLEDLLNHPNSRIYSKASNLLRSYFGYQEDVEEDNTNQFDADEGTIQFDPNAVGSGDEFNL